MKNPAPEVTRAGWTGFADCGYLTPFPLSLQIYLSVFSQLLSPALPGFVFGLSAMEGAWIF